MKKNPAAPKPLPKNFNISLMELSPNAQRRLEALRKKLDENGYGGSIARAVRVALNQWAKECGADELAPGKEA